MNRLCSLLLIIGAILIAPTADGAVTWDIDASGQLVGARNVDVNGMLYDVEFVPGTCADAFGSCDVANFQFQTSSDAAAASQALLD